MRIKDLEGKHKSTLAKDFVALEEALHKSDAARATSSLKSAPERKRSRGKKRLYRGNPLRPI